jgi:hypothetical protein
LLPKTATLILTGKEFILTTYTLPSEKFEDGEVYNICGKLFIVEYEARDPKDIDILLVFFMLLFIIIGEL